MNIIRQEIFSRPLKAKAKVIKGIRDTCNLIAINDNCIR